MRVLRPLAVLAVALAACAQAGDGTAPTTSVTTAAVTTGSSIPDGSPDTTAPAPASTSTTAPVTTTTLDPLERLEYRTVLDGLPFPTDVAGRSGAGTGLLTTKDGKVWRFDDGTAEVVLDISGRVRNEGERGLLGIALDPEAELVYLHYSAGDGDTVLSEFVGGFDGIDASSERVLLRFDQPAANHNGGPVRFGPDGMLYLALGDGGGAGDRFGNGQDTSSPLGGILRIDPRSADPYGIPDGNPFVDGGGLPELWVYGLRNPWKIDFDGDRLYVADVGQNRYEEVSVVPADAAGANFGWPLTEGFQCYDAPDCDPSGTVRPAVVVEHGDAGTCSISGGVVYRGSAIPELDGHYVYSDYCGGWLRSFRWDGSAALDQTDWTEQVGVPGPVVGVAEDWNGELLVLTPDAVLRVVPVRG
jgi:glucose/arabinose dehydrogenase